MFEERKRLKEEIKDLLLNIGKLHIDSLKYIENPADIYCINGISYLLGTYRYSNIHGSKRVLIHFYTETKKYLPYLLLDLETNKVYIDSLWQTKSLLNKYILNLTALENELLRFKLEKS